MLQATAGATIACGRRRWPAIAALLYAVFAHAGSASQAVHASTESTSASRAAPGGASPVVEVNGTTLVGANDAGLPQVAGFKGVPFAAPPVGELRWREPQPAAPRTGIQLATSFAPACYQDGYLVDWYRRLGAAFAAPASAFVAPAVSEDCLYLNVWTPRLAQDARLPVMVWIYGGSNRSGWTFEPNYHGARLAARGDVVVVTIAYRVGVFGFFAHPGLRGSAAPANFGLLDQVAALRWVRDHIAGFGGDPGNVTVFGESAGASNIGYLVSSPLARGLFRRAISQSGGFQMQDGVALPEAEALGVALSQQLPGEPDLAALRQLSSQTVWEAALRALPGHDYAPVVDGRSVLASPAKAYARDGIPFDLLVGSNEDEWLMYVDADAEGLARDLAGFPQAAKEALQRRAAQEADVRAGHDKAITLVNMVCPGYLMAAAARKAGHAAWVYHFTRVRPGPGGEALRSYHGAEIPYVFGTHDAWLPRAPLDEQLTDRMLAAWSAFARDGNPNGADGGSWPLFEPSHPRLMQLGDRSAPRDAFDHGLCLQLASQLYPGWPQ